jgi:hypothetical protein
MLVTVAKAMIATSPRLGSHGGFSEDNACYRISLHQSASTLAAEYHDHYSLKNNFSHHLIGLSLYLRNAEGGGYPCSGKLTLKISPLGQGLSRLKRRLTLGSLPLRKAVPSCLRLYTHSDHEREHLTGPCERYFIFPISVLHSVLRLEKRPRF